MSDHLLPYLANCSMLFTELPLLRAPGRGQGRPGSTRSSSGGRGRTAGARRRRGRRVRPAVARRRRAAGRAELLRRRPGRPDCGVLSIPGRAAQFRDNIDVAVGIGERLGVAAFNALYGNRVDGVDPDEQDELAAENLGAGGDGRGPRSAAPCWSSRSADRSPTRCAPPPTRSPWCDGARAAGDRQRRLPVRPVPPGQQRRRRRRGDRRVRRPRRARADRRRARARRAGHRRARPRPATSAALAGAATAARSAWSTSPPTTTETSLAWLPASAPRRSQHRIDQQGAPS